MTASSGVKIQGELQASFNERLPIAYFDEIYP